MIVRGGKFICQNNKRIGYILFICFIVQLASGFLCAHEIYLSDGRTIRTNRITKQGDRILYEKYGGTITIGVDQVEKIIYKPTGSPSRLDVHRADRSPEKNLVVSLKNGLSPATPIEEANLATVFIQTAAGSGSGFFLSDDGWIITNRHVVRGSPDKQQQQEQYIDQIEKKLTNWKGRLDLEQERIRRAEDQQRRQQAALKTYAADRYPERVQEVKATLRENEKILQEWKKDHRQRLKDYQKQLNAFKGKAGLYHTRVDKLSSQFQFTVTLADGTVKQAVLYKISNRFDLALLKLSGYTTPFLEALDAVSPLPVGSPVYALGSPLGLKGSVTSGIISGYRDDYIQTNAEIYPGNSGGPLVTEEGKVVGVNTMKMITHKFEGLGFAIPVQTVLAEFKDYFDR